MMNRTGGRKNKKRWILIGILMAAMVATAGFAMGDTPGQLSGKTPAQPAQRNAAVGEDVGDFTITGIGNILKSGTDYTYDDNTGVLTIKSTKGMMISNQSDVDTTSDRIEITSKANLILAGVNIETKSGPALEVNNSNVTITLADGTTNTLTSTGSGYAGLQKSSATAISSSGLTIQGGTNGTGSLIATGGKSAAGIGGGLNGNGNNITISGGTVTVKGGDYGAGIGGGGTDDPFGKRGESGRNIIIRGGKVEATGGFGAAGIGGGMRGTGNNIAINGGKVEANGGYYGSGIGSGYNASESGGNKLAGNAVVFATSGGSTSVEALGGFSLTQGITFTRPAPSSNWTGAMYGDVAMGTDATFPVDLTVAEGQTLSVKEGVTLTIADGVTLYSKGTLNADAKDYGAINCPGAKSEVQTYLKYNPDGGTGTPNEHYVVYKVNGNQQKYATGDLLEPENTGGDFVGWYADAGKTKSPATTDTLVYLNEHTLYAKWAECPFEVTGGTEHTDWEYNSANGVLNIKSSTPMTISNTSGVKTTSKRINVVSDANLTLAGVNIKSNFGSALSIEDNAKYNVTITLADGTANTLDASGAKCFAGLGKGTESKLTIQGGKEGTGSLTATGGSEGAGIGGGINQDGNNITISGGTVEANGGENGAGIGGGNGKTGSEITISGGTVKANGGENGAGIGGGYLGTGSGIEIKGGQVEATGGDYGAGIGGGIHGSGSNIIISGGKVKATGRDGGAGIGGGEYGEGQRIEIKSNGTVEAQGGESAAGIGGGFLSDGSDITISGGEVKATGGSDNNGNSGAGIGGGGHGGTGSNITISGGTVNATGGQLGAGIGGGSDGSGSNITIGGGTVNATGGSGKCTYDSCKGGGAGIGGGDGRSGTNITISGGTVTATSGKFGAGIGGGSNGSGSNITISDGTVTATGGSGDYHHRDEYFSHHGGGAGIGGGASGDVFIDAGSGSNIIISGGQVKATGRDGGAGIGGGGGVSGDTCSAPGGIGSNIAITGGTVEATGSLLTPANIFWTKQGGAGIGSGARGDGAKNNKLEGNAVLVATSGWEKNEALGGFSLKQGIAFTRQGTSGSWSKGMYGDVAMGTDATFPADLTIAEGQTLSVKEGATLTIADGATLYNKGTLNAGLMGDGMIACHGTGKVTTLLKYNGNGGTPSASSIEYTYLDSSMAAKTYGDLATATRDGYDFAGWWAYAYGTQILAGDKVNVNLHTVYAHWTEKQSTVVPNSEGKSDASSEAVSGGDKVTKPDDPELEGNTRSVVGAEEKNAPMPEISKAIR